MNNILLYTWIDVQTLIQNYYIENSKTTILQFVNFHAYWDGLTISFSKGIEKAKILEDLKEIFKFRLKDDSSEIPYIELEGGSKCNIVFYQVHEDEIEKNQIKPLLSNYSFIGEKEHFQPDEIMNQNIYAFHSFKGGVGRTLHAMALAIHLLKEEKKVLLIDADFEAPGISWIFSKSEISFSDLLAMYHGSENKNEILNLVGKILEKEKTGNLYVLPAFRNLEERIPFLDVKPENIIQFNDDPFVLTKMISNLGKNIGVDHIIIDLRAGLSELSAAWFFDPNIQKIFVTTLSSQSLLGTDMLFKSLANFRNELELNKGNELLPMLIFSQLPSTYIKDYEDNWADSFSGNGLISMIRDSYKDAFIDLESLEKSDSYVDLTNNQIVGSILSPITLFTQEYDNLKSLPNKWNEVNELIERSKLDEHISKLGFKSLVKKVSQDWENSLTKLKITTEKLIFAETSTSDSFFVNNSIKNIATGFRVDLPIAVVVGAKGSGKTFLFSQIFNSKYWSRFVNKILKSDLSDSGLILPITIPSNFDNQGVLNQIPKEIKSLSGQDENVWQNYIKPDIENSLKIDLTVSEWRTKWLDYIVWAAGFNIGKNNVISEFLNHLQKSDIKLVAIFDGLEDLFKEFNNDKKQQTSIAALLQDVPNWLGSQSIKYLGAIIFIRRDIVTSSITQNSGQFLARYKDYELQWVKDEALRLIHWILNEHEIFSVSTIVNWENELSNATEQKLIETLYPLWGMRMAKDTSNEAYTDKWVLGALANLNKQIQSRDIVRFLHYSSEKSLKNPQNKTTYPDRLLFPAEIKKAIDEVGKEKLEEVKVENEPLKKVLSKLEGLSKILKFPCKKEDINSFNEKEIEILTENGVIKLHEGEYYMAEIFRKAMKFDYSRKGKPKVLYL